MHSPVHGNGIRDSLLCDLLYFFRVDLCRYEGLGRIVYARLHLLQRILDIVPASVDPGHAQRTDDEACYTPEDRTTRAAQDRFGGLEAQSGTATTRLALTHSNMEAAAMDCSGFLKAGGVCSNTQTL